MASSSLGQGEGCAVVSRYVEVGRRRRKGRVQMTLQEYLQHRSGWRRRSWCKRIPRGGRAAPAPSTCGGAPVSRARRPRRGARAWRGVALTDRRDPGCGSPPRGAARPAVHLARAIISCSIASAARPTSSWKCSRRIRAAACYMNASSSSLATAWRSAGLSIYLRAPSRSWRSTTVRLRPGADSARRIQSSRACCPDSAARSRESSPNMDDRLSIVTL